MQGNRPVRGVQCLAAAPSLRVDLSAGRNEPRDVGDRVADCEAGAVAFEVERLVEVA